MNTRTGPSLNSAQYDNSKTTPTTHFCASPVLYIPNRRDFPYTTAAAPRHPAKGIDQTWRARLPVREMRHALLACPAHATHIGEAEMTRQCTSAPLQSHVGNRSGQLPSADMLTACRVTSLLRGCHSSGQVQGRAVIMSRESTAVTEDTFQKRGMGHHWSPRHPHRGRLFPKQPRSSHTRP